MNLLVCRKKSKPLSSLCVVVDGAKFDLENDARCHSRLLAFGIKSAQCLRGLMGQAHLFVLKIMFYLI